MFHFRSWLRRLSRRASPIASGKTGRLKQANATRPVPLGVELLEVRLTPTSGSPIDTWTGMAGDGQWSTGDNWSTHLAPTSLQKAAINEIVTVTHSSGSDTINSLTVGSGAHLQITGGSAIA
jgi:hypothetical protein